MRFSSRAFDVSSILHGVIAKVSDDYNGFRLTGFVESKRRDVSVLRGPFCITTRVSIGSNKIFFFQIQRQVGCSETDADCLFLSIFGAYSVRSRGVRQVGATLHVLAVLRVLLLWPIITPGPCFSILDLF